VASFGCFSYAITTPSTIRLHFLNADADGHSPLGVARFERRRSELTALFAHLKRTTSEDVTVVGVSWLYNLEAYRRLFPASYVSSARAALKPGTLSSMSDAVRICCRLHCAYA
jgi:hypothetical protein